MNILFLSRDYPPQQIGGVGVYIYEISSLLARMGHRVFVISEAIERPLQYRDNGVHVYRISPGRIPCLNILRERLKGFLERLEYSLAASRKIKELIARHKIDIVESCEARAEGFWHYFFKKTPPLVIRLHTSEGIIYRLNRLPDRLDRWLTEKLEEWWILRASRLIGISRAATKLTERHYRIRSSNIPIIPNPVDINLFVPQPKIVQKDYILYVGRLEFRKGVHVLVRAIPHILTEFPEVKFILIGSDSGMKEYILDKATQLKIQDSIKVIDQMPRARIVKYYQQSLLCVAPSLWENFPYVILEAMACGKAVVASRIGGIAEIIKDGENGILSEPGSVLQLAEKINKILGDQEMQRELGRNARRYIEENYAPVKLAAMSLKAYEELLS